MGRSITEQGVLYRAACRGLHVVQGRMVSEYGVLVRTRSMLDQHDGWRRTCTFSTTGRAGRPASQEMAALSVAASECDAQQNSMGERWKGAPLAGAMPRF
jgi:hypothetical protein